MSGMKFSVDEPPQGFAGVRSGPQAVCVNGHEQCSDFHRGPCTELACSCETGYCRSCDPVRDRVRR